MQINQVSNVKFQAKEYYISKQARENAQKLLQEMNKSTKYKENSAHTGWNADLLSTISTDKNVKFTDTRYFIQPIDKPQENIEMADFTIQIGKNYLSVNSTTGKILRHKTGMFTSLNRVISKAENYINYLLENFKDSKLVKKQRFCIAGFTQKGLKILEEAKNKI